MSFFAKCDRVDRYFGYLPGIGSNQDRRIQIRCLRAAQGVWRAAAVPTTADGGARRRVVEGSPAYRELMILVAVLARVWPGSKDAT